MGGFFTRQARFVYIHLSLCPIAEAVGCIWWVVGVCAAVRKLLCVWMQWFGDTEGQNIYEFSRYPQLKLWVVSGGLLGFVRWRGSCVVFGCSRVWVQVSVIYTCFLLSHS